MFLLTSLIDFLFNVYALGLLVYVVLSWIQNPNTDKMRRFLEGFYMPFLLPLRKFIKPVFFGGTGLDLTPIVLLVGIVIVRQIAISLLIGIP